jgi:membrane protease YdiL (CAAX protease family)
MTLFALTLSTDARAGLLLLMQTTFTLYVLLSFIAMARYTAKKIKTGRLINGRASPLSFLIPPAGEWLFVLNIMALLFVPSALYQAVVLAALLILLAVNRRIVKDGTMMPQAGAWFFVLNVFVLLLTQSQLYMILVVTGVAVLLIESGRTAQEQFGLERLTASQLVKWSLLTCGAVIVVVTPLTEATKVALNAVHLSHSEQQSVEIFRQISKPSQIVGFLIQAVLIAPMIEELFFRGFLLTFLKSYMSTWIAVVLSAGIFAIAHQNLESVLPLWLLGVVLGVAYEHTGSILLPMGIHACFNLATGLSLLAERAIS